MSSKASVKVGVKDVAEHTGVSAAAVSLVLNDRPGVSNETRRRVRKAVKQLGYEHRRSATDRRGTHTSEKRFGTVGFYAFGVNAALGHSYYGAILTGASTAARDVGLRLTFEAFEAPDEFPTAFRKGELDGLLITGRPPREFVASLAEKRVPYVLVCCSLAHLPGDHVGPENIESSYRAVQYLVELGHRRIAYLGGEPANPDARERYLGYRWAVEDLGLDQDEKLALLSFFDTEHGVSGLGQLLARRLDFTAIYTASDFLAMGVYQAARQAGLSIPDDLSVVGFDNNSLSETLHPELTTVGLDRERVGRTAVERLHNVIRNPQAPLTVRLRTDFIKRASCASPRGTL